METDFFSPFFVHWFLSLSDLRKLPAPSLRFAPQSIFLRFLLLRRPIFFFRKVPGRRPSLKPVKTPLHFRRKQDGRLLCLPRCPARPVRRRPPQAFPRPWPHSTPFPVFRSGKKTRIHQSPGKPRSASSLSF